MGTPLLSSSNSDAATEQVKLIKRCPVCRREHRLEEVSLVHTSPEVNVLHITCPFCRHAVIAALGATQQGIGLMGSVTDLTSADLKRLAVREPMNDDELLEAAELLRVSSHDVVTALGSTTPHSSQ